MNVVGNTTTGGEHNALHCPQVGDLPSPSSKPEELRLFHALAQDAAQAFRDYYKDPSGHEPRPELLNTPKQEQLVSDWLQSADGRTRIERISQRVISFVTTNACHGHPGHDTRHVLFKDPVAGLRLALEENLSPSQALFIIPSLLHDAGRLYEPILFGVPQSGTKGIDHGAIGFLITDRLIGSDLRCEDQSSELSQAIANLRDELLNAVLDHQTGNSRTSFIAQAVQRCDREQLVGYEMLHRSMAFDTGFYGLSLHSVIAPERLHTLPLPGKPDDDHLFHHLEFYMRNLFPNVGRRAQEHVDKGKVESGIFLWLAASPAMRAQIFAPELARERGDPLQKGAFKQPLEAHVWRKIRSSIDAELSGRIALVGGDRSLEALALDFLHPPHATRTDLTGYHNWTVIQSALGRLSSDERQRMRDALAFGLHLAEEIAREDTRVINEAVERFGSDDGSLLGVVARLVHVLNTHRS